MIVWEMKEAAGSLPVRSQGALGHMACREERDNMTGKSTYYFAFWAAKYPEAGIPYNVGADGGAEDGPAHAFDFCSADFVCSPVG